MIDLECPYCGAGNEVNHDDGAGYDECETHQMQCQDCEKYFTFTTSISYSYEPSQADCLNDGKHQYKPMRESAYLPDARNYAKMRCKICDETRRMTDSEWEENQLKITDLSRRVQ